MRPILTRARPSLFDRLRRATALRVLLACAALLASQTSLACALEESTTGETVALVAGALPAETADTAAPDDGGCCALCTDCAHSGGCCVFAASPRAGALAFALASLSDASIGFSTSAPVSWTPPTLLRPPIAIA